MRISISAQSWDSVPPAPGWMDRMAPFMSSGCDRRMASSVSLDGLAQEVQLLVQGLEAFLLLVLLGQDQPVVHVGAGRAEALVHLHLGGQTALFLEDGRQLVRLVPCAGLGQFLFDFIQAFFAAREVKDASRGCRIRR